MFDMFRGSYKRKPGMVTALARRKPFTLDAGYFVRFRVFRIMRDSIHSRFRNGVSGFVGHRETSESGFALQLNR
jgi:hypothetical protein